MSSLGDGTNTDSNTPVNVVGLSSGVSAISKTASTTCALITSGGVKCWGYNGMGQLGNNSVSDSNIPVELGNLTSGVDSVSAGPYHTCVLLNTGGVKCAGYNLYGGLGDGTNIGRLTFVDVVGLSSGVTAISAGYIKTCAILSAGGVKCWGSNEWGEIGDRTNIDRWTPVDVMGLY
jgi:alpha-tubulin suppressor-like RCC1 family protein